MKKIKWFFLAIVFAAVSSAFATSKPATLDTLYYINDDGQYVEVTNPEGGDCILGSNFCQFTLAPGHTNDQDPASYVSTGGSSDRKWVE